MIRRIFAALLGAASSSAPATLESALDAARAASAAADAGLGEAQRLAEETRATFERASATFDDGPADDDAAAKAVLDARNARDLADLRRDRAAKRADAALAEHVAAEHALEKSRAVGALDARTSDAATKARVLAEARRNRAAPDLAEALARLVDYNAQRDDALRAEVDTARAEHVAALGAVDAQELALLDLAPELAEEIAAVRAARDDERRAELLEAASVATYRAAIADDVAIVVLAERLLASSTARIADARNVQIAAAKRARAAGLQAADLDEKHLQTHVMAARASTPDERGRAGYAVREFCGSLGWPGYTAATPSVMKVTGEEILEAYLGAARPSEAGRAVCRLMHLAALRAGDVNARKYENDRAVVERDEELAAAFAEGTPIAEAAAAEYARRFGAQQEKARHGR
ncbi:MAG: hypothetical protein ABJE95_32540, partial [Byssovorax sp.]